MRKKPEFTVVRGTHVSEFERRFEPEPPVRPLTRFERLIVLSFVLLYGYAVIRVVDKLIRYFFEV